MKAVRLCTGGARCTTTLHHASVRCTPHTYLYAKTLSHANTHSRIRMTMQDEAAAQRHCRRFYASSTRPTQIPTQQLENSGSGENVPYSFNESTRPALDSIPEVKLLSRITSPVSNIEIQVNGRKQTLPSIFLRDSCSCEACVNFASGQKRFQTTDISPEIRIREARQLADASILLRWENDLAQSPDGHMTRLFPSELLTKSPTPPVSLPAIWTREDMGSRFRKIDYSSFMSAEEVQHDVLADLVSYGLVFLKDVPKHDEAVERIAERIGVLRETFYGRTWDVKDKPQAENVAYTNEHLGMHMDLLYMRYPPGFQILHCMQSAGEGGESMFIDAFHAARLVEEQSKESFEALQKFPVTYNYTKGSHYYRDTKVTFETQGPWHKHLRDAVDEQRLSKAYLISVVNWGPPFQGPFGVDIGGEEAATNLRQYHEAARMFADIVDAENNQFRYKMKSNECVIFNNRRVMHGRTEFRSSSNEVRLLKGAYVDTDDILSKLTDLERKLAI